MTSYISGTPKRKLIHLVQDKIKQTNKDSTQPKATIEINKTYHQKQSQHQNCSQPPAQEYKQNLSQTLKLYDK